MIKTSRFSRFKASFQEPGSFKLTANMILAESVLFKFAIKELIPAVFHLYRRATEIGLMFIDAARQRMCNVDSFVKDEIIS